MDRLTLFARHVDIAAALLDDILREAEAAPPRRPIGKNRRTYRSPVAPGPRSVGRIGPADRAPKLCAEYCIASEDSQEDGRRWLWPKELPRCSWC